MKIRAIVFCGDCWHPPEIIRLGLAGFGANGFEFQFCEGETKPSAEHLNHFDLAVIARANILPDRQPWLKSDAEHDLTRFVHRGGGLLALHAGISRFDDLPELDRLLGGAFVHHPELCAVTLEPAEKNSLASDVNIFSATDEHYFVRMNEPAEIFLQSRSQHGVQPAGWTRHFGDGRVCVLTPGHTLEMWRHPEFQKCMGNALRWTAGRH